MKIIATTLLIIAASFYGYSQTDSIDFRILESAKLQLVSEMGLTKSIESLKSKIDTTFKCEFIETKGFDNTVHFILLSKRPARSHWDDSTFMQNHVYGSCEYILCYYEKTRMFYKLKGFVDNNVLLFFQHLCYFSPGHAFPTILLRGNRDYLILDMKLNLISLPRIDLLCLYDYWRSYLKGSVKSSDCLRSCILTDLELMGIPNDIYTLPKGR